MTNEKINFSITPEDVIRRAGWAINKSTKGKLVLRRCPPVTAATTGTSVRFSSTPTAIAIITEPTNARA
jgi:hypothetical protein